MSISKLPFFVFSFNKRLKPFNKIQENIYEIKINAFFLTLFNNRLISVSYNQANVYEIQLDINSFFYINITPFKITQIRGDIRICFHEYV